MRRFFPAGLALALITLVMAGCATTPAPAPVPPPTPVALTAAGATDRDAGLAKIKAKDNAGALVDFNHWVELEPTNPEAWRWRSEAKDHTDDYAGAEADCDEALKLDPTYAPAYLWRGWAKSDAGDRAGALADFNRALELEPKNAKNWAARGSLEDDAKDYAASLADLNRALKLDPNYERAYNWRGWTKMDTQDYAGALKDFNRDVQLVPKDAYSWSARGRAKDQTRDYAGAIADLTQSLELDPKNADAYYWRGKAKIDAQDDAGAVADFNHQVELDPKNAHAWYSLGLAKIGVLKHRGLTKASTDDWASAVATFDQSLKLDPTNAEAYFLRGSAKVMARDIDGGVADLHQALKLKLDADEAEIARNMLAEIEPMLATPGNVSRLAGVKKLDAHDYAGAETDFNQWVKLEPKNAEAWFALGGAKTGVADYAGAIATYDQSLKLDPTDAHVYYWRASAKWTVGEKDEARADYAQALKLSTDAKLTDSIRTALADLQRDARAGFRGATVNGQPAYLVLDTGSSFTILTVTGAKRLGVGVGLVASNVTVQWFDKNVAVALSQPVRLALGQQAFTVQLPVGNLAGMPMDGFIGWSDVQDDILVFDPATHTVSGVAELPAETAGWLKLPVRKTDRLGFETTGPDGKTGLIMVDTGEPNGVNLAPARWKAWRTAHPDTIEAAEIQLGGLTLTNVPVQEEIDPNIGDDFVARLGLAALSRMNLVVDTKGGFAYVKPKPPILATKPASGPKAGTNAANSSDRNPEWTVADSVQVNGQGLLLASAGMKTALQDYAGAMADTNQILQLNPKSVEAYVSRGMARNGKGDHAGAMADLAQAIELDPKNAAGYFFRSGIERKAGDNDAALADFKRAQELDPDAAQDYFNSVLSGQKNQPSQEEENARVLFADTTVNGRPVKLVLDTGSQTTVLITPEIDRLGLKVTPPASAREAGEGLDPGLSEPVTLAMGTQSFTARLPVIAVPANLPLGLDGLIGWSEVRDNILVFDGDKGTVTGVDKVPAETDGWLKLPVRKGKVLLLEVAQPDGKTGAIFVDTGSSSGVALPPEQWKAWRAAHPHAPSTARITFNTNDGSGAAEEAWADEITVGNLTLTDVPVGEASALERAQAGDLAGTLGLYALTRMDLVVDAKGGFAYVRPKPGPGPTYAGFKRPESAQSTATAGDWKATDSVQVSQINLDTFAVYFDARAKSKSGDFDGAIADYTRVIEINPKDADVYENRGEAEQRAGDYDGAIADLSRSLELGPKAADMYIELGLAHEGRGDFAGAVADYDQAIALKPEESKYARLYREVAQLRLGNGKAPPDFAREVAGWKDGWAKWLGKYLEGEMDEAALLAAAQKKDEEPVDGQLCEAYYFIGMKRLLAGDAAGARDFWKKSLATDKKDYYEYKFAEAELGRGLKN